MRRLQACALTLLLLGAEVVAPVLPLLTVAALTLQEAQARSSGGYSLPASPRTPSFGGSRPIPRTPSTSGGYSRPSSPRPFYGRPPSFEGSAGDRAFSRERSAEALRSLRAQEGAAQRPRAPVLQPRTTTPPANNEGWRGGPGYGSGYNWDFRRDMRPGWYSARGWSAPDYARDGRRSFGVWDGLFLWFLLSNLTQPGYADFFHNHQGDPGYQQWRTEADRLARDNADLRQQLEQLDRRLAEKQDQPRDPNYLPPDVPPEVTTAPQNTARTPSTTTAGQSTGSGWSVAWVILLGGVMLAFLAWRRGRSGRDRARGSANPTGTRPMNRLQSAGAMLRHKLSGEGYTPQRFRVGMTLTCDPTPFILAAGASKVPVPEISGGNLLVSVQAVGRADEGAAQLIRLYLPDQRSLFQLHLDPAGNPDECRFFGLIDEITPADASEWAAWLDPNEGMIGWPEFQTKDGKLYTRAWAPGSSRIPPRELTEAIETAEGTRTVKSQAMLYAAPTGLAAPAPQAEYILVAAIEAGNQAWVEIRAGIDINPAALSLT